MKTQTIYIFIDTIYEDYKKYFEEECELELVKDLTVYLSNLSKTSKINLITKQDVAKVANWFLRNDLYCYIDNITNPMV